MQRVPELLLGVVSSTSSTRSAFCSGDASLGLLGHHLGRDKGGMVCCMHP